MVMQATGIVIGIIVLYLLSCIRILREYQRGVIFRLGRALETPKGPGLILVFWPIDTIIRVSLRTIVEDVPSQDVITRDNVSVKVNAVVYFRVAQADQMRKFLQTYYPMPEIPQTIKNQARSLAWSVPNTKPA